MTEYLDWVVGFTTLINVELMIRKKWYCWLTALLNQGVWFAYIYFEGQWGLLPLNLCLVVKNTRGLLAWTRNKENNNDGKTDHLPDAADTPGC